MSAFIRPTEPLSSSLVLPVVLTFPSAIFLCFIRKSCPCLLCPQFCPFFSPAVVLTNVLACTRPREDPWPSSKWNWHPSGGGGGSDDDDDDSGDDWEGRVGLCWWRRHAACVRCLPDKWRLAICDSEKPLHASVDWTRSATSNGFAMFPNENYAF